MAAPVLSFIIPTYNGKEYICETIDSALNQTEEVEVIVVDDGSVDGTPELVEAKYDQQQVRVFRQSVNGGPSAARNRGLREAKGEYCTFLDSDDLVSPAYGEKMLRFMREGHYPLAYCETAHFADGFLEGAEVKKRSRPQGDVLGELLGANFLYTGSIVGQRDILLTVPFDESMRHYEDWECYVRLARRYPLHHCPEVLHFYRCRTGSLSGEPAMREASWRVRGKIEQIVRDEKKRLTERQYSHFQAALIIDNLVQHQYVNAWQCLCREGRSLTICDAVRIIRLGFLRGLITKNRFPQILLR